MGKNWMLLNVLASRRLGHDCGCWLEDGCHCLENDFNTGLEPQVVVEKQSQMQTDVNLEIGGFCKMFGSESSDNGSQCSLEQPTFDPTEYCLGAPSLMVLAWTSFYLTFNLDLCFFCKLRVLGSNKKRQNPLWKS